mmetsp:Transcript_93065/g.199590  ORF Transcript_93065/g.199590 Transcript_93065/m.199590 type:complete len:352 (+) Transcript_93065:28-1083(+)
MVAHISLRAGAPWLDALASASESLKTSFGGRRSMEVEVHSFATRELEVHDLSTALKGEVVLRWRRTGAPRLGSEVSGFSLVGAAAPEDAPVVAAEHPADPRPRRHDPVCLIGEEDTAAPTLLPVKVHALLSHLLEAPVHSALQLQLRPVRWLEHWPALRHGHDPTRPKAGRALRVPQEGDSRLVEGVLPGIIDHGPSSRILLHIRNNRELVRRQAKVHALRATERLVQGAVRWVHVVIGLRGDGLVNLALPLVMELAPPLILVLITVAQGYGRLVGEVVPTGDVLQKALEPLLSHVVLPFDALQDVHVIPFAERLDLLPLALDFMPLPLLWADPAVLASPPPFGIWMVARA